MTRKIILAIVAAIFALLVITVSVVFIYADVIATRAADQRLRAMQSERFSLSYDDIDVRLFRGIVRLEGIKLTADTPALELNAKKIEVGPIRRMKLLRKKELWVKRCDIVEPVVSYQQRRNESVETREGSRERREDSGETREESRERRVESVESREESGARTDGKINEIINNSIKKICIAGIEEIRLIDGTAGITHAENKMHLMVQGLGLRIRGVHYDMQEKKVVYLDSPYELNADSLYFLASDGLSATSVGKIELTDTDSIKLRNLHYGNTVKKTSLADKKGKTQTTWVNLKLNNVIISPTNILHAIDEKSINIGSVIGKGHSVSIYRDVHYPAKSPYPMPQENLMSVKMPLHIGHVGFSFPRANIEMRLPMGEAGKLNVRGLQLSVDNISNASNATLKGRVKLKTCGGNGDIRLSLHNNQACTFDVTAALEDLDGTQLDAFLHPTLGLTMKANIHKLDTRFSGDKQQAAGDLCMQYDSLKLHFIKEDVPLQKLAKNAGVINAFAPLGIHSHNPRKKGAAPYTCHFVHDRNPKQNFAAYVSGSITEGILHTVLTDMLYNAVKKVMNKQKGGEVQQEKPKDKKTKDKKTK